MIFSHLYVAYSQTFSRVSLPQSKLIQFGKWLMPDSKLIQ